MDKQDVATDATDQQSLLQEPNESAVDDKGKLMIPQPKGFTDAFLTIFLFKLISMEFLLVYFMFSY